MKVIYIGPHDGVLLPLPDGREASVDRGGVIDVPDEFGGRLLEQKTNWEPAAPPPSEKKARSVRADDDSAEAPAAGAKEA